jgi:hypothetical protein
MKSVKKQVKNQRKTHKRTIQRGGRYSYDSISFTFNYEENGEKKKIKYKQGVNGISVSGLYKDTIADQLDDTHIDTLKLILSNIKLRLNDNNNDDGNNNEYGIGFIISYMCQLFGYYIHLNMKDPEKIHSNSFREYKKKNIPNNIAILTYILAQHFDSEQKRIYDESKSYISTFSMLLTKCMKYIYFNKKNLIDHYESNLFFEKFIPTSLSDFTKNRPTNVEEHCMHILIAFITIINYMIFNPNIYKIIQKNDFINTSLPYYNKKENPKIETLKSDLIQIIIINLKDIYNLNIDFNSSNA